MIQSVFAYLRLALSKTFRLAVSYTSKLKSLLLKSRGLLMRLLESIRKLLDFGVTLVNSLVLNLQKRLQLQPLRLKRQSMLLLTRLKSKLTSLRTSLSSSNFKNSWLLTFVKKKKNQKQSTTQIKTTWRQHSNE